MLQYLEVKRCTHTNYGSNSQVLKRSTVSFNTKDITLRNSKGENLNQRISEVKTKRGKECKEMII